MQTRAGDELKRLDDQRDWERDARVQRRYGRFFDEDDEDSVDEGSLPTPSAQKTCEEEIVEVIAPQLKTTPEPLTSFEDASIPEFVRQVTRQMGFTAPTVIQKYCRQV
jgi:hypothetical protein